MRILTVSSFGVFSAFFSCVTAAEQQPASVHATQLTQPISITGNVIAQTTGPKAFLTMRKAENPRYNLSVTWTWATSTTDYTSATVPAHYSVGLFIANDAHTRWFPFLVGSSSPAVATWAQRIQGFHDAYPSGGTVEPVDRVFESGHWCVMLAAASNLQAPGDFRAAPNSAPGCATAGKSP